MRKYLKAGLLTVAGIAAGVFLVGRTLNRSAQELMVFRRQHSYITYRLPYHLKEPFVMNVRPQELEAWRTTLCQPSAWAELRTIGLNSYAQTLVKRSDRPLNQEEQAQAVEVLEYAIPIIMFTCP